VARDADRDPVEFASAIGGDLVEVTRILFDQEGNLREFVGAAGSDLLYVESITVEAGQSFEAVAVELLEQLIIHHGGGCFGAAYYRDAVPAPRAGAGAPEPRVRPARRRADVLPKPRAAQASTPSGGWIDTTFLALANGSKYAKIRYLHQEVGRERVT
jgi:hypothetical protein